MRRFSSRLTSGRRRTPRTTLKMAALAPMPRARVRMTVMARPLVRARPQRNFQITDEDVQFQHRRSTSWLVRIRGLPWAAFACRHECGILHHERPVLCSVSLEAREVPCGARIMAGLSVGWGGVGVGTGSGMLGIGIGVLRRRTGFGAARGRKSKAPQMNADEHR